MGPLAVIGFIGLALAAYVVLAFGANAVWLWALRTLPAVPAPPPPDGLHEYVGSFHMHTRFSDGDGSFEEIMAAARPLDFVIVTDHNTVAPVLAGKTGVFGGLTVLSEPEMSSPGHGGHFVTLGDGHSPLTDNDGNCARALPGDACFKGNVNVVTHPFSPRRKIRWKLDYDHVQGFEVFNGDVMWRRAAVTGWGLLSLLNGAVWSARFPWALQGTLVYPEAEFAFVDGGHVPGLVLFAGSDAHQRSRLTRTRSVRFPRYGHVIRAITLHLLTGQAMNGHYKTNRAVILDALAEGRFFIANDLLADARGFRSAWETPAGRTLGLNVPLNGAPATWRVRIPAVKGARTETRVLRDGRTWEVFKKRTELEIPVAEPGAYRLEVYQVRRTPIPPFRARRLWINTQVYTVGSNSTPE